MSNVDTIKGAYAALAARDLEKTLEYMSPDVTYVMPNIDEMLPNEGRAQGVAEVAALMDAVAEVVTPSEFEPREYLESETTVVVIGSEKIHVDASGEEFVNEWVHVFRVTDGRITYVRESFDSLAFTRHLAS